MSDLNPESLAAVTPGKLSRGGRALTYVMVAAVGAVSLLYLFAYLLLAMVRVPYPYDLEWTEGAHAQQVLRILDGQSIYTEPTLEYAPLLYTPLYPYLAAPLMWITGPSFYPLRLISFLSTLGIFWMLYLIARRETGSRMAGLIAAGLYAATYRLSGAWFELARVDSLMLFLLLASYYMAVYRDSKRGACAAGVLLAATFFAKQSTMLFIAPVLLVLFLRNPLRGLIAAGVCAAIAGIATLLFTIYTDGWYWYYTVNEVNKTGFVKEMWVGYWTQDLALPYFLAVLLAVVALCIVARKHGKKSTTWFYLLTTAGIVVMCYLSRLHGGGYANVLMPVYAWIGLLAAIAVSQAATWAFSVPSVPRAVLASCMVAAALVQFYILRYDFFKQLPTPEHRRAGDQLVRLFEKVDGPIFVPYHNFLPALAGKKVYGNRCAIWSLLYDQELPGRENLEPGFPKAIKAGQFELVVWNRRNIDKLLQDSGYRRLVNPVPNLASYLTLTGLETRPVSFYARPNSAVFRPSR